MSFCSKILPQFPKAILFSFSTRRLASRLGIQSNIAGMNASKTITEECNGHSSPKNLIQLDSQNLEILANKGTNILQTGGVIAVPTDTVYGIAADAQNNEAIERIYNIKGRESSKPIAICIASIDHVYLWGKVTVPRNLLEDLLPGPVTLVFERQPQLNPNLNPTTNLIGIRIPDNPFIVTLAEFHNGPIALTSANVSASPSTLEAEEFRNLWPSLDLIFDGGRLSTCDKTEKAARAGSTVIDLSKDGFYRIIREGTCQEQCVKILEDKYNFKKQTKTVR